jgi:hypothetical protein
MASARDNVLWRRPKLATTAILAVLIVLAFGTAPAARAAAPSITIVSPTAGSTVKGTITLEVTATAASGDHPQSISLYDGSNYIGEEYCESQQTCTASIKWDATGLSGTHKLSATVRTAEAETATAYVEVTIVSPPPTVTIISPTPGSTVEGTTPIKVSAETDPSQTDHPTDIDVYDGVNFLGEVGCQGQRTCQGEVSWKATGLTNQHTLTATVHTDQGLKVTSAQVNVNVVSPPPTVRITSLSGTRLGGTLLVNVSGETNPSQVDYPTSLKLYDGTTLVGEAGCQGQRTCSATIRWNTAGLHGVHELTARIETDNSVSATSPPVYVGGTHTRPHAHVSCKIARLRVRRGYKDNGSCTMPGVPAGTAVSLQYRVAGGSWRPVTSGHVLPSERYLFFIRSHSRTTIQLSVLVGANKRYAATRKDIGTLHVT